MEACGGNNKLEAMIADGVSYLRMRLDAMKLDTVEGLAKVCVGVIGVLMLAILCTLGLLMLVGVLTFLLGMAIGSMIWAVVIVAVILISLGILMFVFRRNLFGNYMVGVFARMFFKANEHNREGGEDEE